MPLNMKDAQVEQHLDNLFARAQQRDHEQSELAAKCAQLEDAMRAAKSECAEKDALVSKLQRQVDSQRKDRDRAEHSSKLFEQSLLQEKETTKQLRASLKSKEDDASQLASNFSAELVRRNELWRKTFEAMAAVHEHQSNAEVSNEMDTDMYERARDEAKAFLSAAQDVINRATAAPPATSVATLAQVDVQAVVGDNHTAMSNSGEDVDIEMLQGEMSRLSQHIDTLEAVFNTVTCSTCPTCNANLRVHVESIAAEVARMPMVDM